jgi:hypothetical protein
MRAPSWAALLLAATVVTTAVTAGAQTPARIRGTIMGLDDNMLAVKSREGREVRVELTDMTTIAVPKAVPFDDVKEGDFIGATTTPGPNDTLVAVEVHYIPPTAAEGQTASDLQSGAKMNNAFVRSKVTGAAGGNRELTLQYKGATQKIVVPPSVTVVRTVTGTRADLVPGEYVYVAAQAAANGALTATRVQVSKDGVKPGQ